MVRRLSLLALALLMAVCCQITWPAQLRAAERVALVIGNGAYQKVPALPNPPRDAGDMADSLGRLGFTVVRATNTSNIELRKALTEFGRAASGAEMALVFYAGHGIEAGGKNWLLPVDAALLSDADIENEAVSLESVTLQVARARQLGLVILDACRSNPFDAKMQRTSRTRAVSRGLARVESTPNVLVAYAAKDGTTASDGNGRNSPFTAALMRNIETPGLEINFVFRIVHDEVMAATRGEQEPFVYGALSQKFIYLKPGAAVGAEPATSQAAAQAWEAIRDTSNVSAIESFLRYHGDGFYGDLARGRLADLKKTAADALPAVPSRTYANPRGQDGSARFSETGTCTYKVTLKSPRIEVPVDATGTVSNAVLSLTMVEDIVPPCPFAPLGTKPHRYTGTGSVDGAGNAVVNFVAAPGNAPKAAATFTGRVVDNRLVGELSVQRIDIGGRLAWKVSSQFR